MGRDIKLCQVLPLLLLGSSLVTDSWTQTKGTGSRTSKTVINMKTQDEGGLSVAFVDLPDGPGITGKRVLDLGNVSFAGKSRGTNVQVRSSSDRFVVSAKIGLLVQDPSQHVGGATVLVALAYPETSHILWMDGVRLTTTLQALPGRCPVGKASAHKLDIEVPTSLTEKEAALHNSIVVQVIPN
jgi:hypothetical protein